MQETYCELELHLLSTLQMSLTSQCVRTLLSEDVHPALVFKLFQLRIVWEIASYTHGAFLCVDKKGYLFGTKHRGV
jgi:hypothetical protein